jgi:hypothetical protein
MQDSKVHESPDFIEAPVSLSRVIHTLRAYWSMIVLSLAVVSVGYLIVAIAYYLLKPSQVITSQSYRLDFEGAATGTYPNGLKFSSNEIISTPLLLKVYQANHLDGMMRFDEFAHSIFILETNPEYERLNYEYQARLADPKLTVVDRERVQREWESKVASIAKSGFTINFIRSSKSSVPEQMVRKFLVDILNEWAAFAIRERQVLKYQVTVVSPELLTNDVQGDYLTNLAILRSKIVWVLNDIDNLSLIPGAALARTSDQLSLRDISLRLDETVRFRIEPLMALVRTSGLIGNSAVTIRFFESQLAYDERALRSRTEAVSALREALAVYNREPHAGGLETDQGPLSDSSKRGETVMPQLSDSFMDRLVAMANQSMDVEYRQKLVDEYRRLSFIVIPAQQAVTFDEQMLAMLRSGINVERSAGSAEAMAAQITKTTDDVRNLVLHVNQIHEAISRNLNPSTELYTLTAPPTARIERAQSLKRIALYGLLLILTTLPLVVVFCLLHARIREEEASQGHEEMSPSASAP